MSHVKNAQEKGFSQGELESNPDIAYSNTLGYSWTGCETVHVRSGEVANVGVLIQDQSLGRLLCIWVVQDSRRFAVPVSRHVLVQVDRYVVNHKPFVN